MLVPRHLNPLSRENDISPIPGIGYTIGFNKNTPFPGISQEMPQNTSLSRENGNPCMLPPYAFEWSGGGCENK